MKVDMPLKEIKSVNGLKPLTFSVYGLKPLTLLFDGLKPLTFSVNGLKPLTLLVNGLTPLTYSVNGLKIWRLKCMLFVKNKIPAEFFSKKVFTVIIKNWNPFNLYRATENYFFNL